MGCHCLLQQYNIVYLKVTGLTTLPENQAKGLRIPRESDVEGQQDSIAGLPQDWGKRRLHSWMAQNLMCTKTQGKGTLTPQETEPDLPASVGLSPAEIQVGRDSP